MRKILNAKTILIFFVAIYVGYFSVYSILRIRALYAHYFDLGIMHQTVYNTYRALQTFDWGRILEIANPHAPGYIKRMAIHNDILLALLAPLYFIYSGPQALVLLQTLVLASGAFPLFGIVQIVLGRKKYRRVLGLVFVFAYLMYTPMQRANIFDFHAVALSTAFLLYMFYFTLLKKYRLSFLFLLLSLFSKEEVGLTTAFYGLYLFYEWFRAGRKGLPVFPALVFLISGGWFLFSMKVVIPFFRGGNHFAINYYSDLGDSPVSVITGVLSHPKTILKYVWREDTLRYFYFLLGPLAYLPLLSPLHLFVAAPEFGINLLSSNANMRNIIYHYTSVIQPFVFIAAVYGMKNFSVFIVWLTEKVSQWRKEKPCPALFVMRSHAVFFSALIIIPTLFFSYNKSPLFYSKEKDVYPFLYPDAGWSTAATWADKLKDEKIAVSSTGHLAPFFTSRRHFTHFPNGYEGSDYVVVQVNEVYNYFDKEIDMEGMYEKLRNDPRYKLIFSSSGIEVYRKK